MDLNNRFGILWALLAGHWRQDKLYRVYILLVLLAFVKQLFYPAMLLDSYEYLNAAANLIKTGEWNACISSADCNLLMPETRRTPGYPALILLTGFTPVLYLVQSILALFLPVLLKRLLVIAGLPVQAMRWVSLLLFLYPLQYFYTAMLMPEMAVQFSILLLVIFIYEKSWSYAAITLLILVLLKPVFLPASWLWVLAVFFIHGRVRWSALIPVSGILLVSLVNYNNTGAFHYTSIGATNSFEYNIPAVETEYNSDAIYHKITQMNNLSYSEKLSFLNGEAKKSLLAHPVKYASLHLKGALVSLIDPGRYDLLAWAGLKQGSGFMNKSGSDYLSVLLQQPAWLLIYFLVFLVIAILKLIFAIIGIFNLKARLAWIIFVTVAYILALLGPVGSARYLFPVMPLLILSSAVGLNYVLVKFKRIENSINQ